MKKPQVVATPGASEDNVKPEQEMNVMSKNSTAAVQIIPFRQAKLLLVDHGGEPFVPMRPVVQGMGLDWKSQHVKLSAGRFSTCMVEITTQLPEDDQRRAVACLPLRKLPGWLMSIHPNKVRPDLREGIIAYQNECDDVLWSYWNEGHAVRRDDRTVETVLSSTIGTDGFHMLGALIKGKVSNLPTAVQRRVTAKIWAQTHAAFGVRSAADIPAVQLDAARNFIAAYAIEGEFLPKQEASAISPRLDIHYPAECLDGRRPGMRYPLNENSDCFDVSLLDLDERYASPCEEILSKLGRAGYNVDGAWWEFRTYRNKVAHLLDLIENLKRGFEAPQQYVIKREAAMLK
ncbi:phage antirepressor N-terminal domain-containing protein [Azotobacter chroococcum]|uniref:phage antirepressor N-terminal domain-containing protein n=1 Tax=Azotobacter chroococcum TaxID=353 RepID=UPI000B77A498|nr:phage antirepressor N-terminal domain-containing protein [Azotobacter chroococcum]